MRLRNLTLAYTFPKSLLKPLKVENLRIFAQGLNLFTITNFRGLDPEVGDSPTTGLAATAVQQRLYSILASLLHVPLCLVSK